MIVIRKNEEMRSLRSSLKNEKIALVPTMGFLHEGHLKLVGIARKNADIVIVSIFVNPAQFGPNEDLDRYPQDFDGDRSKLQEMGVDAVFYPTPQIMYPDPYRTYILVEEMSRILCGASRPGHFRGVTTVVAKLFNIIQPHIAVFGEKDFQQLSIIKQMVQDLNFPVEIAAGPIIRENDGLAMSSRNKYLSNNERKQATILFESMKFARDLFKKGETETERLKTAIERKIAESILASIDYVAVVDQDTLKPQAKADDNTRILLAVYFGKTRLIDNCSIIDA